MEAPSWLVQRLDQEFMGRLRIRWSHRTSTWHVEEKVGRAALPPIRIREGDDGMIRARDGYALVMTVAPGDRLPCPQCGRTLHIPHLTSEETECAYCKANQVAGGRIYGGYFPLDSRTLLDRLHEMDPLRGANEDLLKRVDAAQAKWEKDRDDKFNDGLHQELIDAAIFQIPKVGYTTGKVFTG